MVPALCSHYDGSYPTWAGVVSCDIPTASAATVNIFSPVQPESKTQPQKNINLPLCGFSWELILKGLFISERDEAQAISDYDDYVVILPPLSEKRYTARVIETIEGMPTF